jgi:hypothetical protein
MKKDPSGVGTAGVLVRTTKPGVCLGFGARNCA